MARIVVITHEYDDFSSRNYLIEGLFEHWRELGHEVVITAGTPPGTSGDIAILHVDCSVVEEAYLDYAKRFPVVLNAGTRDIRKSAISRMLVTRGDDWWGPVVVKSDLNCGGLPERVHNRVAARMGHAAAHAGAKLFEQYEVLDSQALVRRRVWKDPNLVVERFIPECDERGFWLRTWVFFGDSERCNRYCGPRAIVKASETTFSEPVPVPEELREMRARLGFDYGKFDFVVNQGRATLLDANRTPGSAPNLSAHFVRNAGSLAAGINYFLKERAKVTS